MSISQFFIMLRIFVDNLVKDNLFIDEAES